MAINKRAVPASDAGEKFIAKAEGGEHAVRWVRGNRTQITLSIAPVREPTEMVACTVREF